VSDRSDHWPNPRSSSFQGPDSSDRNEQLSIEEEEEVEVEAESVSGREGLPPSYRMRADRHYVDQLAAPSAGQPVRMLPVTQIEYDAVRPQSDIRPLIESIRVHGIVQPLLVRRQNSRYVVVAGRKRLLAAQMLRLQAAPCLVHELTDAEAVSLAAADNLSIGPSAGVEPASPNLATVRRLLAAHVATIRSCAGIGVQGSGVLNRSALDLLKAHAWRAAQLLSALETMSTMSMTAAPALSATAAPSTGTHGHRERALATIVDEVIDSFAPEARLSGVTIRAEIREALSSSGLNDGQITAGLIGAVSAMLPLVEQAARPALTVKASGTGAAGVLIEVIQADAPVEPRVVKQFFQDDPSIDRPGGYTATLGALVAKAVAEQHNGNATFEAMEHGSRLTMLVTRRS
jgi:hypothetical protein